MAFPSTAAYQNECFSFVQVSNLCKGIEDSFVVLLGISLPVNFSTIYIANLVIGPDTTLNRVSRVQIEPVTKTSF